MSRYPDSRPLHGLVDTFNLYVQLQAEYGAAGVGPAVRRLARQLRAATAALQGLRPDPRLAAREPDDLCAIRALRPAGPRRLWATFAPREYAPRLEGALLARFAGCTLGAPVEGWPIDRMEALARANGQPFHPRGEGNGYVLGFPGCRVYVAGDTENIPEMAALKDIAIAFLPMNLPYTMTPEMTALAAKMVKPRVLYPYHFSNTDPQRLVALLQDAPGIDVRIRKLK